MESSYFIPKWLNSNSNNNDSGSEDPQPPAENESPENSGSTPGIENDPNYDPNDPYENDRHWDLP